jgi:hypothetical protein
MRLFYAKGSNSQLIRYADAVFLIRINVDLKHDIYLQVEVLLFHGDLSSKHLLLLFQITQRLLQFMKQVGNAYG